ncbi:hypothetical protein D1007_25827 [Hordeum vulgare]|nr:hypothetical protein D1007_25827 [Hordeum vulgare]
MCINDQRARPSVHRDRGEHGYRTAFASHFLVDFGLSTSSFLRHFLESYGLQMDHLRVKSVLYIACFVMLCEAYLGIFPFPSFFYHFFYFRSQKHDPVD